MQTRFAIIELRNTDAEVNARVFVSYFKGRWAAMRLDERLRAGYATALSLRDSGLREPRVADLRTGVATVSAKVAQGDKPFVEIGMLLKRYVFVGGRGMTYDDPMDWVVKSITEITLKDLALGGEWNTGCIWDVMRLTLPRLWISTASSYSLLGYDQSRITNLLYNMALNRTAEVRSPNSIGMSLRNQYAGMLANISGAFWRNGYYDSMFGTAEFIKCKLAYKRVGALLAEVMSRGRLLQDNTVPVRELMALLRDREQAELFTIATRERIAALLTASGVTDWRLSDCGHFENVSRLRTVYDDGQARQWCSHCHDHYSVMAVDLNRRIPTGQAYRSDTYDDYYSYDIDEHERNEARREYEEGNQAIMDYTTNVTRVLKPDMNLRSSPYGDFLMGVELEMTTNGASRTVSAKAVRKALGKDYCVIKNDGSLPDDGFEVVTAPRGLKEHIERFTAWEIDPRFRAWDTNQCGLHVHIHSRGFTEMSLGKFLMFMNLDTNAVFLRKLAGRHPFKDTWAARYCAQEGMEILENPKSAVKGKSRERYRIVNTQNLGRAEAERLGLDPFSYSGKYDTVELRIFRASLKKTRLLAQIEFAHAAVMFCRVASYRDLSGATFLKWLVPHAALYPNLANWFGVRRSKVVKDAGGKALEEVCEDKVVGEMAVPQRAVRSTRRRGLPANINQYLTPAERRTAQARELRERIEAEQARLRQTREHLNRNTI